MSEEKSFADLAFSAATRTQNLEQIKHDKLTAVKDVERARQILRKDTITSEEMKEIYCYLTGNELKHLDVTEYERFQFALYLHRLEQFGEGCIGLIYSDEELMKFEQTPEYKILLEKGHEKELEMYNTTKSHYTRLRRRSADVSRRTADILFFLLRSSLGVQAKGLQFFARENKKFEYNTELENVPKEHRT